MGTWDSNLYQDDIAQDIRDDYSDQLKRGKVLTELEQKLMSPISPEKKIIQYKLYQCEWGNWRCFCL